MSSTSALIHDRMTQLRQEEIVDKKLSDALRECPVLVNHFLLHVRSYNRYLSKQLYDAPFYKMPSVYAENLEKMNQIQNQLSTPMPLTTTISGSDSFHSRNQNRSTCEMLRILCDDLEKKIKPTIHQ